MNIVQINLRGERLEIPTKRVNIERVDGYRGRITFISSDLAGHQGYLSITTNPLTILKRVKASVIDVVFMVLLSEIGGELPFDLNDPNYPGANATVTINCLEAANRQAVIRQFYSRLSCDTHFIGDRPQHIEVKETLPKRSIASEITGVHGTQQELLNLYTLLFKHLVPMQLNDQPISIIL